MSDLEEPKPESAAARLPRPRRRPFRQSPSPSRLRRTRLARLPRGHGEAASCRERDRRVQGYAFEGSTTNDSAATSPSRSPTSPSTVRIFELHCCRPRELYRAGASSSSPQPLSTSASRSPPRVPATARRHVVHQLRGRWRPRSGDRDGRCRSPDRRWMGPAARQCRREGLPRIPRC